MTLTRLYWEIVQSVLGLLPEDLLIVTRSLNQDTATGEDWNVDRLVHREACLGFTSQAPGPAHHRSVH